MVLVILVVRTVADGVGHRAGRSADRTDVVEEDRAPDAAEIVLEGVT